MDWNGLGRARIAEEAQDDSLKLWVNPPVHWFLDGLLAFANEVERLTRADERRIIATAREQELALQTCVGECNPYRAPCGAEFCSYEAMLNHSCPVSDRLRAEARATGPWS